MKLRAVGVWLIFLIVGGMIGWVGNSYWTIQVRKTQSLLALGLAEDAAKKDDLDTAIQYATQAWVLYEESPLADVMLLSLKDRRTKKLAGCAGK